MFRISIFLEVLKNCDMMEGTKLDKFKHLPRDVNFMRRDYKQQRIMIETTTIILSIVIGKIRLDRNSNQTNPEHEEFPNTTGNEFTKYTVDQNTRFNRTCNLLQPRRMPIFFFIKETIKMGMKNYTRKKRRNLKINKRHKIMNRIFNK